MAVRGIRGLALPVVGPWLRRTIAVLCALAFVLVSFAHGAQHFSGSTPTAVVQADLGSADDGPDTSNKASVAFEHCHGCSMIATVVFAPATNPDLIVADMPVRRFDQHRPHAPVAETPPPILSI